MIRVNNRIVVTPPFKCPLTRDIEVKFSSLDDYLKSCSTLQERGVKLSNNIHFKRYERLCTECPNYKNPTRLMHKASIMKESDVMEVKSRYEI